MKLKVSDFEFLFQKHFLVSFVTPAQRLVRGIVNRRHVKSLDLPMVEIWEESNPFSVNLRSMQVFPTPESPSMSSLNKTSYCLAILN